MKKININILKISLILFCMIVSFGATTYYTIVPNMSCNASKVVVGETCIYTGSATFYPSQPDPMPEVHYNFSFPQGSIIGASTDGHIVTHKFTEPGTYDIYFDAYADNTEDIIYITEAPAEAEYEVPSIDGGCSRSPSGTAHVHLNEASPFELEASVYYLPSGQIASDFGGAYITIPGPYPQDSTATVSITGGSASAGYQKVTGTVSFSTYGNHFLEYGADVAYSYPSNNEIVWFEQAGAGSSLSYIVDRPTHLILDISTRDISASIDTATSISTIINVNGGDNIDLSLQVKYADTTNASGAPLYYQMSENNFVTVDYTNTTGFGVTDGDGQALLRLNTKSEYSGTVNVTLYCNDIEDVSKNKIIVQIICRGLSSETSPHPYAGGIIDVYTGQFNFSVQDISVPGRGMSLNFTRTYSTTREPMSVSEFYATKPAFDTSFHWTYNYNAYIDYNDAFANVTTGSGRKDFYINTAGGYRPPRSMHTQLIKSTGTTGFTLKEKDGTKYIFDKQSDVNPSGLTRLYLTKIYDKNNNSLTLSYETSPVRLTCVADDFDRKITIEYESITPPPAPLDSYTYRIKKVKDPIGRETVYSYNNDYNLSSIAYPDGTQASYSYEKPGDDWFITSYTDPKMPKGITHRSFTYTTYNNKRYACDITDGAGKKELHIDPSGIEGSGAIVYTSKSSNGVENSGGDYDIAANTKTTYKFTDSCWTETVDDLNRTSKYTWDYNLNQLSVEDPITRKTYYTYDEYGNKLTSSTTVTINSTPVTVKSLYEYENRMTGGDFLLGLLTKSTDPLGKISKNEYDTSGNLVTIRTQEPLGALTEANMFVSSVNTYNTNGQVVTTVKYLDDTQTTAITTAFEYDNTNGAKGYATGQLLKAKLPNTNGVPDDAVGGCECTIGQTQPCGIGLGICVKGTQSCINGKWSAECTGTVWPLPEACDGVDNNCNGVIDEGCSCANGQTQECGSDVPICRKGTSRCANGQWNSTCENAVLPVPEACDNLDNDCNGETDTGCPCRPIDSTQICGINVGECREGRQTCTALGWGSCAGDVRPANETCDGRDNDCDGKIDNGCPLGIFILEPQNGVSKTQIFNITISTNKDASCAYSKFAGRPFREMSRFILSDGLFHRIENYEIKDAAEHLFYVKCNDTASGNISEERFALSVDLTAPRIVKAVAIPETVADLPYETLLHVETDDKTVCRASSNSDIADFDLMEWAFHEDEGNVSNYQSVNRAIATGLRDGSSYKYSVACKNLAGMKSKAANISFRVNTSVEPQIAIYEPLNGAVIGNVSMKFNIATNKRARCTYGNTSDAGQSSGSFGTKVGLAHISDSLQFTHGRNTLYARCEFESSPEPKTASTSFTVDLTPPSTPEIDDSNSTSLKDRLSAKWKSQDGESGISLYNYSIYRFGSEDAVKNWTVTSDESATVYDLNLSLGASYYFRVMAQNGVGVWSETGRSDGVTVQIQTIPQCSNAVKDSGETGIDCGGKCLGCPGGSNCTIDSDCRNGLCNRECRCSQSGSGCDDGIKNQDETGIDCGGSCSPCGEGEQCLKDTDCRAGYECKSRACIKIDTCSNEKKDGDETDIDCGGASCIFRNKKCDLNELCRNNLDCASGSCVSGKCSGARNESGEIVEVITPPSQPEEGGGFPWLLLLVILLLIAGLAFFGFRMVSKEKKPAARPISPFTPQIKKPSPPVVNIPPVEKKRLEEQIRKKREDEKKKGREELFREFETTADKMHGHLELKK